MAAELDEIDRRLLRELQADADRPNVELARLVGLSPAATLNRVRRLKEEGVITGIRAVVDPKALGYPLQVYVAVQLAEHDERAHRRFEAAAAKVPQLISATWVTGETDILCEVVARDVDELQRVLMLLSAGGAQRILTLLRLEEMKPRGPIPAPPRRRGAA
jgi:Lrp/AsnC family transcriptional regulator, leucine-responsive regulatory protein